VNASALRALEAAYQSALAIQAIEKTHFNGGAIMAQPGKGKTVTDYFRTQLDRELLKIRSNLLRFRLSGFLLDRSTGRLSDRGDPSGLEPSLADESLILDRLALIESIIGKYREPQEGLLDPPPDAVAPVGTEVVSADIAISAIHAEPSPDERTATNGSRKIALPKPINVKARRVKTGGLSASARLFGGASQIRKEFSPQYEQEVVQELRVRRTQNRTAVRWLAILLLVPLLVQFTTKQFVLTPLFDRYSDRYPTRIELSERIQEDFLEKFGRYKEILEVKALLAKAISEQEKEKEKERQEKHPTKTVPPTSKLEYETALATAVYGETPVYKLQDILQFQAGSFQDLLSVANAAPEVEAALEEKALEEKALELWREEREEQLNGLKNLIADSVAIAAFVGLVLLGRDKLTLLQGFSNRAFLSLNDPTKVFLFILFTDMFVGFHSAEGWEVILESVTEHFGLPGSKVFINGFIATVPVIIDACIKFWIFSYLTRYSPSTSAIYERMNT
jgi:hypothetical protein